ncbi:uncharacterized protein LOC126795885 [Argentina anserina]|uniref:uncharacterized protein LOC126795885 n=1 Tax=Argentina anserina TaxID=57926 RepID=UPI0021762922|nr:uncharacterized protein LOC126795885 [Potentilla anserina]
MANFIFKIIIKILADRLGSIATRIISPNQSAFLRGRIIADPIILTSECINLLDHNCKGGNIAIKFDVQKEFNTLDWDFLLRVLKAFGFSDHFYDWIKAILGSAHLSILVNEVLSRGLTKLAKDGLIDLLSAPIGITPPSHVLFVDDIMVFMRGTKRSLKNIMKFMKEYGLNSGQRVNKSKSLVFLGKYTHRRRFVIRNILGVKQRSLPFTYLGVPIFQGRLKSVYFQAIADRVRCKLSSWKCSLLSQADNLLGEPIATSVGVSGYIPLHAKVNDVIVDSHWVLPADLFLHSLKQRKKLSVLLCLMQTHLTLFYGRTPPQEF